MLLKVHLMSKSFIIAAALFAATLVSAEAQVCKVTDPTTSKLNVRDSPSGKIIGKLANGRLVYIDDVDYDAKGRAWALVFDAKTDRYLGWVFREFISCYQ